MNGFSADPEGLIAKGQSVLGVYEELHTEVEKIAGTVDNISTIWIGDDAKGYANQIHSYDADFEQLKSTILRISEILKNHGQRLVNSREAISDLASRL